MAQDDYSVANAAGATVRADINSQLGAIATNNSGTSAPGTTFGYQWWMDTTNAILKIRNGANSSWVNVASLSGTTWIPYRSGTLLGDASTYTAGLATGQIPTTDKLFIESTLTANSATPSVSGQRQFVTNNSSGTAYTNFTGGFAGQEISIRVNDANTSFVPGANLSTLSGLTLVAASGDIFRFRLVGSVWKQFVGGLGRGASRFVPVFPPDAIGDWIASTQTTFTDVDVSDDGVPKGASAVLIQIYVNVPTNSGLVRLRANGGSDNGSANNVITGITAGGSITAGFAIVPLDSNGVFEAKVNATLGATTEFSASVWGYFIG